jgi:predicted DNA-binding ribbon-helix-helix protein
MPINVRPVSITLADKTYDEAHSLARAREMSVSALIRDLLAREFAATKNDEKAIVA